MGNMAALISPVVGISISTSFFAGDIFDERALLTVLVQFPADEDVTEVGKDDICNLVVFLEEGACTVLNH